MPKLLNQLISFVIALPSGLLLAGLIITLLGGGGHLLPLGQFITLVSAAFIYKLLRHYIFLEARHD